ncbi:MAG TPA: tRNA (adenosine(37)-N6)-dimethylallyltransferase MiaA [Candidatus Paceibacterota bacterium]|nr:tRNA (adenosine(37)-N6)-dimethylallyltransferase MiaA [Candidatus Paceibacterota bacterium]
MSSKPLKILVVLGPTASGKSDLAVQLAKEFNGEIISADSRQVYRHLNIGTGKITEREMRGIPHHLLDIVDPDQRFTALEWRQLAEKAIADISSRGKLPIICGGTGFYISSLIDNLGFPEVPADTEEQKSLEARSVEDLFDELKKLDPERTKTIDMKNKRRLARAIIIARALGSVPKLTSTKDTSDSPYDVLQIGLVWPDTDLRARIKARLIRRIEVPNKDGINMIQEAEHLHAPAPSGLGLSYERMDELGLEYRYLAEYLQMKIDKIKLIEILVNKIWQYAKRQMTWWKKDARIKWYSPENIDSIEKDIEQFLK